MKSGLSLEMAAFAVLSSELGFSKCRLSKSFNCSLRFLLIICKLRKDYIHVIYRPVLFPNNWVHRHLL